MTMKLLRPFTFLFAVAAMLLLALSGPASSEGYGDPAIVPEEGGTTTAEPGEAFEVSFSSNVECAWSSRFDGQTGPGSVGFDYSATFQAPTDPGTYTGTVVCRYSTSGPFRPVAFSEDALDTASRTETTTQTFTVVVGGAGDGKDTADEGAGAKNDGALANTGGDNWQILAIGAGLVVVGAGVAVAARRRTSA